MFCVPWQHGGYGCRGRSTWPGWGVGGTHVDQAHTGFWPAMAAIQGMLLGLWPVTTGGSCCLASRPIWGLVAKQCFHDQGTLLNGMHGAGGCWVPALPAFLPVSNLRAWCCRLHLFVHAIMLWCASGLRQQNCGAGLLILFLASKMQQCRLHFPGCRPLRLCLLPLPSFNNCYQLHFY